MTTDWYVKTNNLFLNIQLNGDYISRLYMLGAAVFTLKFVDQHYIVNTLTPNLYTCGI